jgi:hypothetical protein
MTYKVTFSFNYFTGHVTSSSSDYRPAYLDHFDKNPKPANSQSNNKGGENPPAAESKVQQLKEVQPTAAAAPTSAATATVEATQEQAVFQRQFDQVTQTLKCLLFSMFSL